MRPATLNYRRSGEGEPLLLIHGTAGRLGTWDPIASKLAEQFDVIAIDLPGCGKSPDTGDYSVQAQVDKVADFLTELGIQRAHLAGDSLGGTIALELAARGRTRSTVAFSPAGFGSAPGRIWFQVLMRSIHAIGGALRPALPFLLRHKVTRTALFGPFVGRAWALDSTAALAEAHAVLDSRALDGTLASFWSYRLAPQIDTTTVPVTIAWGTRDVLLTYATQSRRARRILPGAKHIPLPGCGHIPFYDDPDLCAGTISSHLAIH